MAVDRALNQEASAARDAALARVEECLDIAPGYLRLLRAEIAPVDCADLLVEDTLARSEGLPRELRDALVGLGLAARLARLVRTPPRLEPPFDKQRFMGFLHETLAAWIAEQAVAIQRTAEEGARLEGYGRGVVAIEAGLADLRFVEVVRQVPLPEDLARDTEWADVYYGALDQALEPRKHRGRDAALVGLRAMSEVGILRDQRITRARTLLSQLYNGRRVDALDGLLLPPLPPLSQSTPEERLAARLPTFVAGGLLGGQDPRDPALLRALSEQGLPRSLFPKLEPAGASTGLGAEAARAYARILFASGQLYWRAMDFAKAGEVLLAAPQTAPEGRLMLALIEVLGRGPRDAAEMMARGPMPHGSADVSALDRIAAGTEPTAGMAAFDAALILGLAPPEHADPQFWRGLEARFRRAAHLLQEPKQQALALDRAEAAAETANLVQGPASN